MVIKRRPVPTTKDIEARKNLSEKENQTMQKEIVRKPRKTIMQIMQEEREKMEQERLQQEKYNQQVEDCELMEEVKEEMIISNNQDALQEYNLEKFIASTSKTISKTSTEAGVMSVINSKNSRRITLDKDVMSELSNPEMISISFSDDSMAIAEKLPNNDNLLKVSKSGGKGVIYSAGLVSEITNKYMLDFSNRTSITFSDVEYIQHNGFTIAIIKVK
ncbi:hypothetical protein [Clostridium tertium]|uniref:hypothetical protein n=1 Tax=Clostridium tertium TaxID=1559 RepID=UPI0035699CB5